MTDLSAIILVGREERHIRRCLERLAPLEPRQVFVVESQKGDRTHEIATQTAAQLGWRSEKCEVRSEKLNKDEKNPQFLISHFSFLTIFHDYPGNQTEQFNWALDNLPIEGCWILRLDADEYLTAELIAEIRGALIERTLPADVDGVVLKRRHYFAGGWAKHGTYPVRILRLFRTGRGRYAPGQVMDERIEVGEWVKGAVESCTSGCGKMPHLPRGGIPASPAEERRSSTSADRWVLAKPGKVIEFDNDFVDHSLIPMGEWRAKHRAYAKREAAQALEGLRTGRWTDPRKASYYRLPPYFRAFAYFFIRYILRRGFLDGYAGWMWNFWQGLWYRLLVDREISRLKKSN